MAVHVLTNMLQRVRNMLNPMEKSYSASVQKNYRSNINLSTISITMKTIPCYH